MNAVTETKSQSNQTPQSRIRYLVPDVTICENDEAYVVQADLPGVTKETLEVTLDGNQLTVVGRRPDRQEATVLYRESQSADFKRVFEMDPAIDVTQIGARMEQGVLTLELPKSEAVKPRRIAVV